MTSVLPAAQRPRKAGLTVRTLRTIVALMLREMVTTYGRSPGGYLWAFLEPIGGIVMLTIVFGAGLRLVQPPLGINFAMFYATGILVFQMYNRMQQKVAQSISYSHALLRYPAVNFFDAIAARFLLNFITQSAVVLIVLVGLRLMYETRTIIDPTSVLLALVMVGALSLGIGTVNAFLMPLFPTYALVWGILTTPLLFVSGVLYTMESLPDYAQGILWYNPLMHITGMMRKGFYAQYHGQFVSPLYVIGIGVVLFALGYVLISRYYRSIIEGD